MALPFDDRILGEKVNNYCSSSEGEAESGDEGSNCGNSLAPHSGDTSALNSLNRKVSQTGPKGVIEDYKQYQRLKAEQAKAKNEMAVQLATQCALTSRPYSVDMAMKEREEALQELIESLEDDDLFLREYRQKRLADMHQNIANLPTFGRVFELTAETFVEEIDNEPSGVTVIVHIFEEGVTACKATNESLPYLCKSYPNIKFCKIRASQAAMSKDFVENGVPALLVYKNKELVGNLIAISKELDDFFTPEELETYIYEHGFLPPRDENSTAASRGIRCASPSSDSD